MKNLHQYLIKYSGDIGTKQSNSKWTIVKKLAANIIAALKAKNIKINHSEIHWSHIIIETYENIDDVLKWIPGIQHFSKAEKLPLTTLEDLKIKAFEHFKPLVENKQFAVRVKVVKNNTIDASKRLLEKEIGALLFDYSKGVNLTKPDITCFIEIREKNAFLYGEKIKGIGGFPVGSHKNSVVLYSGGIDSPVAVYRALRVGALPDFIYFDLGGEKQLQAAQETLQILQNKFLAGQKVRCFFVPFQEIMVALQQIQPKYQNLGLKVFFYRFAEKLARYRKKTSIITGESVGQVSTQTMPNLNALQRFISVPVMRPLAFYTKEEIMKIARQIGTFDASYKGEENCAIAAKNVAVNAQYKKVADVMAQLPVDELTEKAFQNRIRLTLSEFIAFHPENLGESISGQPENSVYIDLSGKYAGNKNVESWAFNDAWQSFFNWDTEKMYYIYCENGVKSKTLANFMTEQGFKAKPVKQIQNETINN